MSQDAVFVSNQPAPPAPYEPPVLEPLGNVWDQTGGSTGPNPDSPGIRT